MKRATYLFLFIISLLGCFTPICGDGIIDLELGEQCDDGNENDDDACPSTCNLAFCGDGFIQNDIEECDDGNEDNSDGCGNDCRIIPCDDKNPLELNRTCDVDGDGFCNENRFISQNFSGCPKTTRAPSGLTKGDDCNDQNSAFSPETVEICDNISNNCDGQIDEGCDDDNDDFCDPTLQVIPGGAKTCPNTPNNGLVNIQGNDCNDNNPITCNADGDTLCNANIDFIQSIALCGGETVGGAGRDCNDNNTNSCNADGDAFCSALIANIQGNALCAGSVVGQAGNDCNDNNAAINPNALEICDGIDSDCSENGGAAGEACQDGNATNGDGCSSICEVEPPTLITESENNGSFGTANEAGNVNSAIIEAAIEPNGGDVDFFSIQLQNNEDIKIEVFDGSGTACVGIDTIIELIDTNGTTVLVTDDDDGQGNCSLINPAIAADAAAANLNAGTYFIRVIEKGQNANIGAYRVVITVTN